MRLITNLQEFLQVQATYREVRHLTSPEARAMANELRLRMELALDKGVVHFQARPGSDPVLVEGPRN